ncbi:MAG: PilZ domain-containing protein [Planctomycetota bacterium]|nr:PilZ domain-containing protein [Planctomycetota bacterium]
MSECPYTVLTDLRQFTRFGREFGAEEVVIWTSPGEEKLAYVHDESLGGLGLYLDEVQGLENGSEVDMVYTGQLLRGCVRHIEPHAEGGYVVGFECHEISGSAAKRDDPGT